MNSAAVYPEGLLTKVQTAQTQTFRTVFELQQRLFLLPLCTFSCCYYVFDTNIMIYRHSPKDNEVVTGEK